MIIDRKRGENQQKTEIFNWSNWFNQPKGGDQHGNSRVNSLNRYPGEWKSNDQDFWEKEQEFDGHHHTDHTDHQSRLVFQSYHSATRKMSDGFVWKCCVALNPMVLLIIIPMKNGYFIGNINPTFSGPNPDDSGWLNRDALNCDGVFFPSLIGARRGSRTDLGRETPRCGVGAEWRRNPEKNSARQRELVGGYILLIMVIYGYYMAYG